MKDSSYSSAFFGCIKIHCTLVPVADPMPTAPWSPPYCFGERKKRRREMRWRRERRGRTDRVGPGVVRAVLTASELL